MPDVDHQNPVFVANNEEIDSAYPTSDYLSPPSSENLSNDIDLVEIKTSPLIIFDKNVEFSVAYTSVMSRQLKITCSYKDVFDHIQTFSESTLLTEHKNMIIHQIELPEDIVYYDYQNIERPTNFFVKNIEISVLAIANYNNDPYVVARDSLEISLPSPWHRKDRPTYCQSWLLHIQKRLKWKYIPKCSLLADTSLFSSILSFPGNEGGYVRKMKEFNWPGHILPHIKERFLNPSARFTLSFWAFFLKDCTAGLCMIVQHRNSTHFFSPLILLNNERKIHVQFQTVDGKGHAFTSIDLFPLKTWIHMVLTVDINIADLYIMYGTTLKHYHHVSQVSFNVNVTDGIWATGGYSGSNGFPGYLSDLKLYRNQVLPLHHIQKHMNIELNKLSYYNLEKTFHTCLLWRAVSSQYILRIPHWNSHCKLQGYWTATTKGKETCPMIKESLRKNVQPRMISYLKSIYNSNGKNATSLKLFAKMVYDAGIKEIMKTSLSKSMALRLLELSGCLGYVNGYFLSATMNAYGLGIKRDARKAVYYHLLSSQKNNALSQLALAYRYQLGVDDTPKDVDVMAGYLRQAAVTSKKTFEQENHKVHTQSEMIRLDQAHLFRDVRGSDSDLFKWLSQQAKMGSSDARTKIAEMFFYGKQGVDANRALAVEMYEQGAVLGDANAIYNLGVINLKGLDVEKNVTKAFEYFHRAADMNSSAAFNSLGYFEMLYNKNRSGAAFFWKKSADLGSLEGMNNYAFLLEGGLRTGDPPDKLGAFEMFKKAALKGQTNACIRVADYLMDGSVVPRDVGLASQYYRFVAEQLSDVGLFMRKAIDSYNSGNWYKSLVNHVQAAEAGIQLAGYNTALLLKEYQSEASMAINRSDPFYFYNMTAELGWSLSLIELGHHNWLKKNKRKASHYYARSVEKDSNPEALFNLGYIVEHGHPLDEKVKFQDTSFTTQVAGNSTIATMLYESCITTKTEGGEGYYPCQLALLKLKIKMFIQINQTVVYCSSAAMLVAFVSIVTMLKLSTEQ